MSRSQYRQTSDPGSGNKRWTRMTELSWCVKEGALGLVDWDTWLRIVRRLPLGGCGHWRRICTRHSICHCRTDRSFWKCSSLLEFVVQCTVSCSQFWVFVSWFDDAPTQWLLLMNEIETFLVIQGQWWRLWLWTYGSPVMAIEKHQKHLQRTGLVPECLRFKPAAEIVTEMTNNFPLANAKHMCTFFWERNVVVVVVRTIKGNEKKDVLNKVLFIQNKERVKMSD